MQNSKYKDGISIIVTLFNKEEYILQTLVSAVNQFRDKTERYQIIIVDDGSKDRSYEVANNFLKGKKIDFKIFTQKNSGPSIATNNALKFVKYSFVKLLDGDDILYILSKEIPANSGVVGTLMTNKALELYFQNEGIEFSRADVGDKYVLQRLIERSWVLGGEPSGHIICLDSAPTGDAIVAALKFLNATKDKGFSVEKSLEGFKKFPQTLINLKVNNPNKIIISDKFWEKVTEIELQLGEDGRVLIRPSGTEPLIRIMVESKDSGISENLCNSLADLAQRI